MRRPRGPGSLRGVLAALVAALAPRCSAVLIAVALLGMITTARDYRDGAERALTRQTAANALLIDLLSAQSANRAYILLARGDDLAAYIAARDRYPREMDTLNARPSRGEPEPRGLGRRGRPHRRPLVPEAVELIRLRRQGQGEEARRRINQGLSEARFNAFRAEHARLLEEIEDVRVDGLADNDRRRR